MGCDCTTYFPKGTISSDVKEFLLLLGFKRGKKGSFSGTLGTPYYYYKDDDYRHITGLYTEIYWDTKDKEQLKLWTRTTNSRSKFDSDFHNYTIKQIRKRFGGYFVSDYGRNRYFQFDGPAREKSEAGAYRAFSLFFENIQRADRFIDFANLLDENNHKIHGIDFIDNHNPRILSANVLVPFLVSAIEDYFRSLYIALLRYSPIRERIVQSAKLQGPEIVSIDKGDLTVIEAVAKWMNFQDMSKVNAAFKDLSSKYDIYGILQRPYGRRRESLWDTLNRIIHQRHALIHRAELQTEYTPARLKSDIRLVEKSMWKIYAELIKHHKWHAVDRWDF